MKTNSVWILAAFSLTIAACAAIGGTSAPATAVTGAVTYRERIALPEDAVVKVQIQDISRADAAAVILGEQIIQTQGKQVPISFAVAYDPAKITPQARISLSARIEDSAGKLMFITDTVTPVINNGPTADVKLVLVRVAQ